MFCHAPYVTAVGLVAWVSFLGLAGCRTLGPLRLPADRFSYNKSLARSSNEQLLLNIVRLRYSEPLHWLEVSSMLSQYSFEASVSANSWWNDLNVWKSPALRAVYGTDNDPSEQTGVDGGVSYSDRPTVSYTPVRGEDFARRLLSPLPISVVLFFAQAGWPIDEMLYVCVDRMNGLPNTVSTSPSRAAESGEAHTKFERALDLLRAAQDTGRLQGAIEISADTDDLFLVLDTAESGIDLRRELQTLLGIDDTVSRIRLTSRGYALESNELAIQTRSLLGTLQMLARFVEVPAEHSRSKMIIEWPESDQTRELLSIRHSSTPRLDAFVQIRHKGQWYYIADCDVRSKRIFSLLTYLYSLQASDFAGKGPLLTVPASR